MFSPRRLHPLVRTSATLRRIPLGPTHEVGPGILDIIFAPQATGGPESGRAADARGPYPVEAGAAERVTEHNRTFTISVYDKKSVTVKT